MTSADIAEAIYAAGGNARVAADRMGIGRQAFYARAARSAIDVKAIRRAAQSGTPLAAVFTPIAETGETGVLLTLADYAVLQARAAEGLEAARLARDLADANRIIATLTARLEERMAA